MENLSVNAHAYRRGGFGKNKCQAERREYVLYVRVSFFLPVIICIYLTAFPMFKYVAGVMIMAISR